MEHRCTEQSNILQIRRDVDVMREDHKALMRFATLFEAQLEVTKEQGQQLKYLSETLVKVSENLTESRDTLRKLNDKMDKIEDKTIDLDTKMTTFQLAEKLNNINIGKIDILEMIKKTIPYIIGAGILYFILNASSIVKLFT